MLPIQTNRGMMNEADQRRALLAQINVYQKKRFPADIENLAEFTVNGRLSTKNAFAIAEFQLTKYADLDGKDEDKYALLNPYELLDAFGNTPSRNKYEYSGVQQKILTEFRERTTMDYAMFLVKQLKRPDSNIDYYTTELKYTYTYLNENEKEAVLYHIEAFTPAIKIMLNLQQAGGVRKPKTSQKKLDKYTKTTRVHTDSKGVARKIYTKSGKNYIRKIDSATRKYVYKMVK